MSTNPTRSTRPQRRAQTKRTTLADQLRDAVARSGRTDHAIATAARVDPSSFGRFMRAERSWTLDVADRVAQVLGLGLIPGAALAPPSRPRPRPKLAVVPLQDLAGPEDLDPDPIGGPVPDPELCPGNHV